MFIRVHPWLQMLVLGCFLASSSALWLIYLVVRGPRVAPFPRYGYLGLVVIATAEYLLVQKQPLVAVYFTPICWTGYIAAIDAAVYSLSGRSLIRNHPGQFWICTLLSIPLWLVFEAYNLRLRNWSYEGLPAQLVPRYIGYGWAFATIWPAMLETSQLLRAAGLWRRQFPPCRSQSRGYVSLITGAVMLLLPLVLPVALAAYTFGLVWLGFIFLLDPINYRLAAPSLREDWERGNRARCYSLLVSGAICGILWEFWNYWSTAKWIYIFPIMQQWKIFEMPAPGFLGFLPFALETYLMYCFCVRLAGHVPDL